MVVNHGLCHYLPDAGEAPAPGAMLAHQTAAGAAAAAPSAATPALVPPV
jgi:hypothetical protein